MPSYFHIAKIPCRCKCGAKVRVTENSDKEMLCPKCYEPIRIEAHATGEPPMMVRIEINQPVVDEFMERDVKSLVDSDLQQDTMERWRKS